MWKGMCVATTFMCFVWMALAGKAIIIVSHQCPHTVQAPASRIHCCRMVQSVLSTVSFPDLGSTPAEWSGGFQQYPNSLVGMHNSQTHYRRVAREN